MEKRGISRLVLISSVALLIVLVAFLYLYAGEKTELTLEEQEKAKSLDLTPKDFKDVSTKAEDAFKERIYAPVYDESAITYSNIAGDKILYEEGREELKKEYGLEDLKSDSKIIYVKYSHRKPSPYIVYLIEDGKITVVEENLHPRGP